MSKNDSDEELKFVDFASRKHHVRNPVVYFLQNGNKTYIGKTVNLRKRLKQHKGILQGGAKYTRSWKNHGETRLIAFISGFPSVNSALSYEYHAKSRHCSVKIKRLPNCSSRLCAFFEPLLTTKFEPLKNKLTIVLVEHHELAPSLKAIYPVHEVILATQP